MKIEIYSEEKDSGTPIEVANALIHTMLDDVNDYEFARIKKQELAEIAEHIQVFLKYSEVKG